MKKTKPGVLFVTPPAYERLDDVMECLEANGFKAYLASFGSAKEEIDRQPPLLDEMKEWPDLACVVYPDDLDFYDAWIADRIKGIPGNISDFLTTLENKGLALIPFKMNWGGAFDDTVVIYSPPINVVKAVKSALSKKTKQMIGKQKP